MGYYEILAYLEKQLDDIQTKHDYLKKKRDRAIQTKELAEEFDLNVRSIREVIRAMHKRDEIEVMEGLIKSTEKYYVLSEKYLEKKKAWTKPK